MHKGVPLRLRRICSTDNEYLSKSIEYQDYLNLNDLKTVHDIFEKVSKTTRNDARKKTDNISNNNRVISSTKFNPIARNDVKIIKDNFHQLQNDEFLKWKFPENNILVAKKRENNLRGLLPRSDPYNIKRDLLNYKKHGYKSCKKKCDSYNNFVDEITAIKCFAAGRVFKIRRDSSFQRKNVLLLAYCLNCQK